ncbi:tetratricopeptide repeat-containing [Pochonia chlamydosporia 170]|uniref:Tetratricopeptide repeat-containing n=1 Tax=Pochonia chlamydosporia 170 TaxID=1380566 RepID=A0A179FC80_METCM|nr:tetratricopeptide repeat-containing [Pochonia chlamydosporia 170]OAQ63175.2 tetratricopeptide repeat-containing [Pochonia chlamydosporia 170]
MRIEEIADEMEKTILEQKPNAEKAHTAKDGAEETKPELPPAMASHKKQTFDEIMADLNKSPLFMTDMEENDDIAALQALNYEGTPLENGADFKIRGNECFKVRGYVDAREFYTKGIQILFLEERKRARGEITKSPEGVEDSAEEIASQKEVLEALYVNRAACHLELDNYRSCWTDCAAALRLNPRNIKACYRSAKALLAVDRIEEADDICARGLSLDPENKGLKDTADKIIKRAKEIDAKNKKDAERKAKVKRREMLLQAALKARGIPTRTTAQPPEMGDTKLELVPDPDDPRSSLSFPTVLLYPEHLESDFIKAFNETQTLEDHLSYVFPLPWDKEGVYTAAGVTCYVETLGGGVLKMGKRVPLLKVLGTGKVEVVDEVMKIFVLPNDKADGWVKRFKEQKAAELGKGGG